MVVVVMAVVNVVVEVLVYVVVKVKGSFTLEARSGRFWMSQLALL